MTNNKRTKPKGRAPLSNAKPLMALGKLLARIPRRHKWLYPFWLTDQLDVVKVTFFCPRLPEAFSGITIAYGSDFHDGDLVSQEALAHAVKVLRAFKADMVVLGGDYGQDKAHARAFFDKTGPWSAPLGVYGAIGNHDIRPRPAELEELLAAMRRAGVRPLVNDAILINRQGASLAVAATDDLRAGMPDLKTTMAHCAKADFVLFVPHSPDIIPDAHAAGFDYDLALCGHTHGGQVTLFGKALYSASVYGSRFLTGHMRPYDKDLYVSNGVGVSVLPVRLGPRPQVHLFTLLTGDQPPIVERLPGR